MWNTWIIHYYYIWLYAFYKATLAFFIRLLNWRWYLSGDFCGNGEIIFIKLIYVLLSYKKKFSSSFALIYISLHFFLNSDSGSIQARLLYAISRIDTISLQNRYRIVESILVSIQPSLQDHLIPKITLTKNHIKSKTLESYFFSNA
jgi:hypothetical protein